MEQPNLTNLTDEELRKEAKRLKKKPVIHAFLIGFLIGIIVFSVAVNSFGFLMLIPLFLIYLLTRPSKEDEALLALIKERNLDA
ncbi:FUSC family protein [Lewinella sp. W8]|uniref:FUSC family protein n=1 Tax=Lewinella sp. W8 TaxID=2528208 RepID=UPI0010675425|nr:FUSC family protein [Lewinella sp. W8]MTB52751.1 FUSC family protein [Lewinella sp. W8]